MMLSIAVAVGNEIDWAQQTIARDHYLHAPVDPRSRPLVYLVELRTTVGWFRIGILMFGRPESSRCYQGGLTYGSSADVQVGRVQFDRWEVLNLARVWIDPSAQPGGRLYHPEFLPGFTDRRGLWRSTLASTLIGHALATIGYDYLMAHPPVDCAYPYAIRAVLSYCDRRVHKGTIYRASGFQLARTNTRQIETWYTSGVSPLTAEQDDAIRRLSEVSRRSKRLRGQRMQLELDL